jgi:hypothetical protein
MTRSPAVLDPPLRPVHDLPAASAGPGVVRRGRGRPRKIRPTPTHEERAYHREIAKQRDQHIAGEPLVAALRDGAAGGEVIRETMLGLARESAALRFVGNPNAPARSTCAGTRRLLT